MDHNDFNNHYVENELADYPYAYDAGQFHRVYLGEIYNNRYRVYRKLGYGCFSTVWLVRDITADRWRAMKVLSASAYDGENDLYELEILQHLHASKLAHPGRAHTLQLLDSFDHRGTEGLHRCLVFPVMGESLATYVLKFPGFCVPDHILKSLARQILLAVDYAHMNGVIHTDIKLENIMIKMKDESLIDEWYMPATIPKEREPPHDQELKFLFWPDSDRVHPSKIPCKSLANYYLGRNPTAEDFENVELVLSDWGVATWVEPHRRRNDNVVPLVLRSPELLLEAPWDEKVDIWATGCLFMTLAERRRLFVGEGRLGDGGYGYNPEFHLADIVNLLGDVPISLLEVGNPDIINYAFDEQDKLIAGREIVCPPLPDWIENLTGEDKELFVDLLYAMFTLDPGLRPPANVLLGHPWFEHVIESPAWPDTEIHDAIEHADGDNVQQPADLTGAATPALGLTNPDGEVTHIDLPELGSERDTKRIEENIMVALNGTGHVAEATTEDVSDGHVHKKARISSPSGAVPHDHEFTDHQMEDADGGPTREELRLNQSTNGFSKKGPVPAPDEPGEKSADTQQTTDGKAAEEEPFLGNENGQKMIRHPLNRGVAFFGTATPVELIVGGFWLFKEVVRTFFRLLG